MKYTDYTDRFQDFIKRYPYVTIEASCLAESDLWANPDCSATLWTFETIEFSKNQYTNKYLVSAHQNDLGWDVGAEIGFGFKNNDGTLYLRPFYNGWVYKAGAWWSCLKFGLAANKITFHPEDNSTKRIAHPSVVIVF